MKRHTYSIRKAFALNNERILTFSSWLIFWKGNFMIWVGFNMIMIIFSPKRDVKKDSNWIKQKWGNKIQGCYSCWRLMKSWQAVYHLIQSSTVSRWPYPQLYFWWYWTMHMCSKKQDWTILGNNEKTLCDMPTTVLIL